MGTPDFAATILGKLLESGKEIVGVVTAPDRPSGRGQKLKSSPVKTMALTHNIPVLQAIKLKDPEFIESLASLNADFFIVVAFRMLPEVVWTIPSIGTFNLHASLLPQYRGAAPINWAIINGEKETGLTTFLIDHKIDTGKIILQEKVEISDEMTAGELHDVLMNKGADLVRETVDILSSGKAHSIDQDKLVEEGIVLKPAPKLFKKDCRINWTEDSQTVYNFIRGLSPYPGAWTIFVNDEGEEFSARILTATISPSGKEMRAGNISSIDTKNLIIYCESGALEIIHFQPEGKKRMTTEQFLRGYRKNLTKVQ